MTAEELKRLEDAEAQAAACTWLLGRIIWQLEIEKVIDRTAILAEIEQDVLGTVERIPLSPASIKRINAMEVLIRGMLTTE